MFARLDGERASSVVILGVAVVLVAGALLEVARVDPAAPRVARRVAGAIFVCYTLSGTAYLLLQAESSDRE